MILETTSYSSIEPISKPIEPDRQGAYRNWGSHPYFTRRAWNVVQEYIKNFSHEGDLILDPFGGSGVTAIEALILRRRAIHADINPLANFICAEVADGPIDFKAFAKEYNRIRIKCEQKINEYYSLTDKEIGKKRIIYWYPEGVKLPSNADTEYIEDLFTKRQKLSLSLLLHEIGEIEDKRNRNLMRFVFSATLNKTNLTFSSTHGRKESRGNSGIMHRYRYWIPPHKVDLNVWEQFAQKYKNILKVKEETNLLIGDFAEKNLQILSDSATNLSTHVESETVDYIYTDPPYGAHIAYLDLSTMWNAWLGFKVTRNARALEVIEGGDAKRKKSEYVRLLHGSIQEMFRTLKFDRWLSIVFAHKDPEYWDVLLESAQEAGFEYVNTAIQNSKTPSLHKRQNPLKVLSGELVLNFRKVKTPRSIAISAVGNDAVLIIKEVSESTIVQNNGATTEEIYYVLIPALLRQGLLGEVKKKMSDITPLLKQEFEFNDADNKWHLRPNTKMGSYIKLEDRIRFYLTDCLTRHQSEGKASTFDDLIKEVMPNLVNGTTPGTQTIISVLESIASSPDGKHWQLGKPETPQLALSFQLPSGSRLPRLTLKEDADLLEHNAIIYALAKLASAAGLQPHIGKKEQDTGSWNGEKLSQLSIREPLSNRELTKWEKGKIEQIDLIWYDSSKTPVMAFEVETSTTIVSGIDRFMELLKIFPSLGRSLVLVVPPKRIPKITRILKDSHYIGHPLYMETKLAFCLSSAIREIYMQFVEKEVTSSVLIDSLRKKLEFPRIGG